MGSEERRNKIKDEMSYQSPPESPKLCANGCDFFGTAATLNLCSKCYRYVCIDQKLEAMEISSSTVTTTTTTSSSVIAADESGSSNTNRCWSCKRKMGLMGTTCKCGNTFCHRHRFPEEHLCTFDFKAQGREAIARANPVIKPNKLQRRI